ncbi:MAG: hypothetical protein V2A79_19870 [Planctomycetota bacterium]
MTPDLVAAAIKHVLLNPHLFSEKVLGLPLRPYQLEVIGAVVDSVLHRSGLTFTVHMARQMGKNETSAHLETYLLNLFQRRNACMVKAAPTFKPQTINSMMRIEKTLGNPWNRGKWHKAHGYIYQLGQAQLAFLSGETNSNVVGHTANTLLEIDEAQDFDAEKYSKDFRPMASTGNATTVMYGTAWTSETLLAAQIAINKNAEKKDGIRRHFEYPWHVLAEISPEYGQFVQTERDRLGPDHPTFLTQYALTTIDELARLFSRPALAAMRSASSHPTVATSSSVAVAGLDIAGEAREAGEARKHDRTVLLLGRAGTVPPGDPVCHITEMLSWQGTPHHELVPQIATILAGRNVRAVAVDTTGIGATTASMLIARLGESRVLPIVYSRPAKSALAFSLIAAANSGRLTVAPPDGMRNAEEKLFWHECEHALRRALPGGLLDFYVPEPDHDDFVNALALVVHAAEHLAMPAHAADILMPVADKEQF